MAQRRAVQVDEVGYRRYRSMQKRLDRAERKALTLSRLLEAASAVFARHGLHGASLEEAAEEAGFSKAAVYSNFESKEDFYFALLEERVARRVRDLIAVVDREAGFEVESCDRFAFRPSPLVFLAEPRILGVARRPRKDGSR